MLAEDKRLLGQRQRTLLLRAAAVPRASHSYWFPLSPGDAQVPSVDALRAVVCVTGEGHCTRESIAFLVKGNKPALCLGGDITSSLKVACCKHKPETWPG